MALREIPHPEELYVDEFRDPKKADRLLREIRTLVDKIPVCRVRPLQIMEVCGGHTHAIFKWGLKDYCRTASSLCMAWLSGLRAADGAGRRLRRIGRAPERDPGDLGRCDPRARLTQKPVAGQGGRDRRAHRLFAARRVENRARPPGQGGRLLRPRLRNDDAEHGLDGIAGRARGHPQFLAVVQSHHNHCDDQSDPRLARADIGRVSRAGACQHGHWHCTLPVHCRALQKADRRRRVRAARHSAGDRNGSASARRGTLRRREPIPAHRARDRQRPRAENRRLQGLPVRRGFEGRDQALAVQGIWRRLRTRDAARRADGVERRGLRGLLQLRRRAAHPEATE